GGAGEKAPPRGPGLARRAAQALRPRSGPLARAAGGAPPLRQRPRSVVHGGLRGRPPGLPQPHLARRRQPAAGERGRGPRQHDPALPRLPAARSGAEDPPARLPRPFGHRAVEAAAAAGGRPGRSRGGRPDRRRGGPELSGKVLPQRQHRRLLGDRPPVRHRSPYALGGGPAVNGGRANPYPGPRAFETEDSARFFGRAAEIRQLRSLAVARRVVLLYAASG